MKAKTCQRYFVRSFKLYETELCFRNNNCAAFVWGQLAQAAQDDFADIKAQITKQHDESVKRLQDWIGQVSIAAENRGYPEGAEYMAKLARDAGFQQATVINTEGSRVCSPRLMRVHRKPSVSTLCAT
jgi:L-lactate utilization protein LutB